MHVLVTGAKGQLGRALRRQFEEGLAPRDWQGSSVDWIDLDELDVSSAEAVDAWFGEHGPYDVVFNCAAMTNVDGCETDFDSAFAANALAPLYLARACSMCDATLVHISTDYVFPGTEPKPRTESDVVRPISAYGRSKLAGEGLARSANPKTHVVRTAWLYGEGRNFVATMLRLAQTRHQVSVVCDQLGNPTCADDLAHELLRIAMTADYGVWHCTNEGTCSWADLAEETFRLAQVNCEVVRCTSEEWKQMTPGAASRPAFSSLENARLAATIGNGMRSWQDALRDYLQRQLQQRG